MGIDNYLAERVFHYASSPTTPEFDEIFHTDAYFEQLEDLQAEKNDLPEKLGILAALVNNDFHMFVEAGQNPLISMFEGHFSDTPIDEIKKYYHKYQKKADDLMIDNLKHLDRI